MPPNDTKVEFVECFFVGCQLKELHVPTSLISLSKIELTLTKCNFIDNSIQLLRVESGQGVTITQTNFANTNTGPNHCCSFLKLPNFKLTDSNFTANRGLSILNFEKCKNAEGKCLKIANIVSVNNTLREVIGLFESTAIVRLSSFSMNNSPAMTLREKSDAEIYDVTFQEKGLESLNLRESKVVIRNCKFAESQGKAIVESDSTVDFQNSEFHNEDSTKPPNLDKLFGHAFNGKKIMFWASVFVGAALVTFLIVMGIMYCVKKLRPSGTKAGNRPDINGCGFMSVADDSEPPDLPVENLDVERPTSPDVL